jgi:hypothetical protein
LASDRDIGAPDPLRLKVFAGNDLPTDERLRYLIEFVAQLDDRLKDLENAFTNYVTRDVEGGDLG